MRRKQRTSITTDKRGNSLSVDAKKGGKVVKKQVNIVKQAKPTNLKCSKCSKPILKTNISKSGICVTCLKKETTLISDKSKKIDLKQSTTKNSKQTLKPIIGKNNSPLQSNSKSPKNTSFKRHSKKCPSEPSSSKHVTSTRKTNVANVKEQTKTKNVAAQPKLSQSLAKTSNSSSMNLRGNKRSYVHLASGVDVEDKKDLKKRKIGENDEELTKRVGRNKKPTVKGSEWLYTVHSKRVSNYQEDKLKKETSSANNKSPKSKNGLTINESKRNISRNTYKTKKNVNSNQINKTYVEATLKSSRKPQKRTITNKEEQEQLSANSKKQNISTKKTITSKNRKSKNSSLRVAKVSPSKGKSKEVKQDNLANSIRRKFSACFTEKKCSPSSDVPENVMIAQYIVDGLLDSIPPSIEGNVSHLSVDNEGCVLDSTLSLVEEENLKEPNEPNHLDTASDMICSSSQKCNTYENCISNVDTDHLDYDMGSDVNDVEHNKNETNVQLQLSDKSKLNEFNDKEISGVCKTVEEEKQSISSNNLKEKNQLKTAIPEKAENDDSLAFENSCAAVNDNETLGDEESCNEQAVSTEPSIVQISNLKDTYDNIPPTATLGDEESCNEQAVSTEPSIVQISNLKDTYDNIPPTAKLEDSEESRGVFLIENDSSVEPKHHPNTDCASNVKDTINVDLQNTLGSDINTSNITLRDTHLVEDDNKLSESQLGEKCNGHVKADLFHTPTPSLKITESEQYDRTFSDNNLVGENLENNMINLATEKEKDNPADGKGEIKSDDNSLHEQNIVHVNNGSRNETEMATDNVLNCDKQTGKNHFNKQTYSGSSVNDIEMIQVTDSTTYTKSKENNLVEYASSNEVETVSKTSDIDIVANKKSLNPLSFESSLSTDAMCEQKDDITAAANLTTVGFSHLSPDNKASDSIKDVHIGEVGCVNVISTNNEMSDTIIVQRDELKKVSRKEVDCTSLIPNDSDTTDQKSHGVNDVVSNINKPIIDFPTETTTVKCIQDSKAVLSAANKVECISELQMARTNENGIEGDLSKTVKNSCAVQTLVETSVNHNDSVIDPSSNGIDCGDTLPIQSKHTGMCDQSVNHNDSVIDPSSNGIDCGDTLPIESKHTGMCDQINGVSNPPGEPPIQSKITETSFQNQDANDGLNSGIDHNAITPTNSKTKNVMFDQISENKESDVILPINIEANNVMCHLSDSEKDNLSIGIEHDAQLNDQNISINNSSTRDNDNSVKGSSVGDIDCDALLPTGTEIFNKNNDINESISRCVEDTDDSLLPTGRKSTEVFDQNDVIRGSLSTCNDSDGAVTLNDSKTIGIEHDAQLNDQNFIIKNSSATNDDNSVKNSSVGVIDHDALLPTGTEVFNKNNAINESLSRCVDTDDSLLPIGNKSTEILYQNDVIKDSSSTCNVSDGAALLNDSKTVEIEHVVLFSDQNTSIKNSSDKEDDNSVKGSSAGDIDHDAILSTETFNKKNGINESLSRCVDTDDALLPTGNKSTENFDQNDLIKDSSSTCNDNDGAILLNDSKTIEIEHYAQLNDQNISIKNSSATDVVNSVKDSSVVDNDCDATLPTGTEIFYKNNEINKSLSRCVKTGDSLLPAGKKSTEIFDQNDLIKGSSSTCNDSDCAVLLNDSKTNEMSDQNNSLKDYSEQDVNHDNSSQTDCRKTEISDEKNFIEDSLSKSIDNANSATETKICNQNIDINDSSRICLHKGCITQIDSKTTEHFDKKNAIKMPSDHDFNNGVLTIDKKTADVLFEENNAVHNLSSIEGDNSSKCKNIIESSVYQAQDQESIADNLPEEKNCVDIINTSVNIGNLQTHIQVDEVESENISNTVCKSNTECVQEFEHNEKDYFQNQNESKKNVCESDEISAVTLNETEIKHSLKENLESNIHSSQNDKIHLVSESSQLDNFGSIESPSKCNKSKDTNHVEQTVEPLIDEMNSNTDNKGSQLETFIECSSKEEYIINVDDDDDVESMQCNSETLSSNRMSVDEENTEMELDPECATSSCEMKVDANEMSMDVN